VRGKGGAGGRDENLGAFTDREIQAKAYTAKGFRNVTSTIQTDTCMASSRGRVKVAIHGRGSRPGGWPAEFYT